MLKKFLMRKEPSAVPKKTSFVFGGASGAAVRTVVVSILLCLTCVILLTELWSRVEFIGNRVEAVQSFPEGIFLLHGIKDHRVNTVMPLGPVLTAFALYLPSSCHAPQLLFFCVIALLLVIGGFWLRSLFVGCLSAVLYALLLVSRAEVDCWDGPNYESMVLALTVTMVACVLILRGAQKRRSWTVELLLGVTIGMNFMVKSILVLLPFALAAYDLADGKLRRKETSWLLLLALCLVPFLMLSPWIYMNYRHFGQFLLFENTRADQLLIISAMGIVYTVEGAYEMSGLAVGAPIWPWVIKTIVAHPLNYLSAVLERLCLIFTWHPCYFTFFLLALARWRRCEQFRLLAVLVFYIVGMHSLLSIESRYMFPMYPVLTLGAALLFSFAPRRQRAFPS